MYRERQDKVVSERTNSAGSVAARLWQLGIFVYRERRAAGAPAPAGHVGLQRLEGHGLRHVEVALPRVPYVVGQVP